MSFVWYTTTLKLRGRGIPDTCEPAFLFHFAIYTSPHLFLASVIHNFDVVWFPMPGHCYGQAFLLVSLTTLVGKQTSGIVLCRYNLQTSILSEIGTLSNTMRVYLYIAFDISFTLAGSTLVSNTKTWLVKLGVSGVRRTETFVSS